VACAIILFNEVASPLQSPPVNPWKTVLLKNAFNITLRKRLLKKNTCA